LATCNPLCVLLLNGNKQELKMVAQYFSLNFAHIQKPFSQTQRTLAGTLPCIFLTEQKAASGTQFH